MKNFSELLEQLREARQMSKKDLAIRANLTPGYISLLTRGERETPSEATVKALADALGIDDETRRIFFESAGYTLHATPTSYTNIFPIQSPPGIYTIDKKMDDGGEAPNVDDFYGRKQDLDLLKRLIVDEHCRLVTILGMGGVGKSALTAKLVTLIENDFDYIFWRSLQNAPTLKSILESSIVFFSDQKVYDIPSNEYEQITILVNYMRAHRCLLVLDNFESVLEAKDLEGQYRKGYEGYGKLLQRLGETTHKSCLLINSREKPREILRLEGSNSAVRSIQLAGIVLDDAKQILRHEGIRAQRDEIWEKFITLYSGNLLALKLVAASIRELFDGDIAEFLTEEDQVPVFGDIYNQLDQQFDRLSEQEKSIMYWLAIEGEPVSVNELQEDLVVMSRRDLLETLSSLRRRSIINVVKNGRFSLQPAIKEYVLDNFVKNICKEIDEQAPKFLERCALLKAQAKDYVRDGQIRVVREPIIKHLLATYGRKAAEEQLKDIIANLRNEVAVKSDVGYTTGNILNLLVGLGGDLRGLDCSQLVVLQAYLQSVTLRDVKFNYANLETSIFTDSFGSIHSVALSPNGDRLAAGTASGEVRVWETASGRPAATYPLHTDWVRSVAFSPDGKYLASGSDDQTICIQDRKTGEKKYLTEHTGRVYSIAFDSEGQQLISGSQDKTVRLWDVNTGQCLRVFEGHQDRVWSVAFSNAIIASGGEDNTVRLWDANTGTCLKVFEGHTAPVWSVAFSRNGKLLASAGEDQTIRLWDVQSGEYLDALTSEQSSDTTGWVRSVTFEPEGKVLVSGGDDKVIRLWDIETGQCRTLRGHTNWVRSVAISLDGSVLASGSEDQTVRIWEMSTNRCRKTLQGHNTYLYAVAFSPDGKLLASSDEDYNVCLWSTETNSLLKILPGHKNWIRSLAFSPDGKYLASGSEDHAVRLWDIDTGRCRSTLLHTDWVYSVDFSPDSQYLASGSEDQGVHLWDVTTGKLIRVFTGHTDWVVGVAFSPDGRLLASCSDDQTVRLWNVKTGEMLAKLQNHKGRVRSLNFTPDGRLLATGGEDQKICLWDLQQLKIVQTLQGHTSRVRSLAFSPSGETLVSVSEDRTIRFWDVKTATNLHVLQDDNRVTSLSYKPDGTMIATSSYDGTLKLWDAHKYTPIATLRGERPYERMQISEAKGLTPAQIDKLKALGAIEI